MNNRDVIVPAFPGTLLLFQWIATKAIPGKTGTNYIPDNGLHLWLNSFLATELLTGFKLLNKVGSG